MRPRRAGDEGVSNVLGAILMFGLLVLTLTVIQVKFVPVWTENREARHMAQAQDQIAQLKADLDRMAGNDTANALTDPLTLKQEGGFQFFGGNNLGGRASFTPAPTGSGVSVSSTHEVSIVRRNGENLFSLDDDNWQPDFVDGEVENVASISHLRERIDLVIAGDSMLDPSGATYTDGDRIVLDIYAATDDLDPVATVITTFHDTGSEIWFTIELFDQNGDEISSDFESAFQQINEEYMYFDLLDGALFLEPMLAAAAAPFRLDLTEDGLIGDYQLAYVDADSGGIAGGAGVTEPSFSEVTESGALSVEFQNQHFVDQTFVMEHGAVLLVQSGAAVMAVPPAIGIQSSGSLTGIAWTVPGVDGEAIAQSGGRALNVLATPTGTVNEVWLGAYELRLDIPTSYGAAWCDHLDLLLAAAGLSDLGGLPDYQLNPTSAACQLQLYGFTSSPTDTTQQDLFLRFRSAAIDLSLVPG
jgi:hypothetical protein